MSEEQELSPHEILLSHVTNVSDVTAQVIRRAVAEHYDLVKQVNQLTFVQSPEGTGFLIAGLLEKIHVLKVALDAVAMQAKSIQMQHAASMAASEVELSNGKPGNGV